MDVDTVTVATRPASMVPIRDHLPDVLPTDRLNGRGMPRPPLRDEFRRIPNMRNAVAVVSSLAQSFGVVGAAAVINAWWSYPIAFVLMARGHVCLSILAHESAHRLLFSRRSVNDMVGRFVIGYPTFLATMQYRRAHFAHHRDELGPDEPDIGLYSGYPISRASWHRKLRRDLLGVSGYKNMRVLMSAARKRKPEALQILLVQAVMMGVSIATLRPLAYVVWVGSWMTLWKVSNRLRAIAEHGGMKRSRDRRETTHVIRQSRLARYWMVPYNTGWHLAHHADMGVSWTQLPRLHAELVASGWVTPDIEYRSYRAFWKQVSSGGPTDVEKRSPGRAGSAESDGSAGSDGFRSSFLDFGES